MQAGNSITFYVPMYNPAYGTLKFRVNKGCGFSGYSGVTVLPGYGCGGSYKTNIFPNPVSDELQLEIIRENGDEIPANTIGTEGFKIGIYGQSGKEVFSFKTSDNQVTLDVSRFYYLHILHKRD